MIDDELYDAASNGDATRFQQLLQEDPYLVERVMFPCSRNVLHIATQRGQVAIVEEVLKMSPQLALELDSKNSSPLHIAASKGNVEIATKLLSVAPEMCWYRDGQGLNPVHIAAMKGHVEMVEELLRLERAHREVLNIPQQAGNLDSQKLSPLHIAAAQGNVKMASKLLRVDPDMCWCRNDQGLNPFHIAAMNGHVEMLKELLWRDSLPAMERVKRSQTVLHLCVKHRQLKALMFLGNNLGDLVYAKDNDGETLLHLAVRSKQLEMVEYLVENFKTMKQSTNSMGKTAYDILKMRPDMMTSQVMGSAIKPPPPSFWRDPETLAILSRKREQTMVVMTLIATMAFQAAVSPPGGVWQDDTSSHRAGEAVMAYTHPKIYKHLIRANTTAFISSLMTIFLVAVQQRIEKGFLLGFSSYAVWISLASTAVSYGGSVLVIARNTHTQSLNQIINIVVALSVSFFVITLLCDILRRFLSHSGVDCSFLLPKIFLKAIGTGVNQDLDKLGLRVERDQE